MTTSDLGFTLDRLYAATPERSQADIRFRAAVSPGSSRSSARVPEAMSSGFGRVPLAILGSVSVRGAPEGSRWSAFSHARKYGEKTP